MSRKRPASDALEARVAARLIGAIAAQPPLPPDTAERLRFARQVALERAGQVREAAGRTPSPVRLGTTTVLAFGGPSTGLRGLPFGSPVPWWQRAAAVLPLVVLVAGLVGIDHWATQEQITTAADIDTALLADDLPPEAYADPGFAEFLRNDPGNAEP